VTGSMALATLLSENVRIATQQAEESFANSLRRLELDGTLKYLLPLHSRNASMMPPRRVAMSAARVFIEKFACGVADITSNPLAGHTNPFDFLIPHNGRNPVTRDGQKLLSADSCDVRRRVNPANPVPQYMIDSR
jgi:hypothetical protein